jgi:hypothetical protein
MPAHRSGSAASVEPSALTDRRSISVTPLDDDDLVDGKAKFDGPSLPSARKRETLELSGPQSAGGGAEKTGAVDAMQRVDGWLCLPL